MKVRFSTITAAALGALLVFATTGSAQNTNSNTNSNQRAERRPPNLQRRMERLTTELKLTEDQQTKVKALLQKEGKEARELRDETSLTRDQRREKMRAIREDSQKELKSILSAEQFEKWQQIREQQVRERRAGGTDRPGEAAPAPAPAPKNADNKAQ